MKIARTKIILVLVLRTGTTLAYTHKHTRAYVCVSNYVCPYQSWGFKFVEMIRQKPSIATNIVS